MDGLGASLQLAVLFWPMGGWETSCLEDWLPLIEYQPLPILDDTLSAPTSVKDLERALQARE